MEYSKAEIQKTGDNEVRNSRNGSENKFLIGKRIAAAAATTIIITFATDDNNGDTHRRSGPSALRVIFRESKVSVFEPSSAIYIYLYSGYRPIVHADFGVERNVSDFENRLLVLVP